MQLPGTIDQVIEVLDKIIDTSLEEGSALGYFAALYQKVTIKVREGIATNRFEDGPRMERLDVIFANRYIRAFYDYRAGKPVTKAWDLAFKATRGNQAIILQHLFLGMNAHINLDLGIAAAEVAEPGQIQALKGDFNEINQLLFELIDEIQDNLSGVSPLLGNLDFLIKDRDEQFARFSMKAARDHAWLVAQRMMIIGVDQRIENIQSTDDYVVELGKMILKPAKLARIGIWLIRLLETKSVDRGIESLRQQ